MKLHNTLLLEKCELIAFILVLGSDQTSQRCSTLDTIDSIVLMMTTTTMCDSVPSLLHSAGSPCPPKLFTLLFQSYTLLLSDWINEVIARNIVEER